MIPTHDLCASNTFEIIVVALYDSAYGPTFRIATNSVEVLRQLRGIFIRLAKREIESFEIGWLLSTHADSAVQFCLTDNSTRGSATVTISKTDQSLRLRCEMSAADWSRCAGLVRGILDDGKPGHQYLIHASQDEIGIELSYLE